MEDTEGTEDGGDGGTRRMEWTGRMERREGKVLSFAWLRRYPGGGA